VLETVDKYDEKYGMTSIRECLAGSKSKNVQKYALDKDRNYGVLKQYSQDVIESMMKSLEREGYLYRTPGMYPKVGLSLKGKQAIKDEEILKADAKALGRG